MKRAAMTDGPVIRSIDAAASLKLVEESLEGIALGGHPQHRCCGLIEAAGMRWSRGRGSGGHPQHRCCGLIEAVPTATARSRPDAVIRSIDAAASLKLERGVAEHLGLGLVIRSIDAAASLKRR